MSAEPSDLTNVSELINKGKIHLTVLNELIATLTQKQYEIKITIGENNQISVQARKTVEEIHTL